MREVIVIDLHLIEVVSIADIKKTAIDDESVIIVAATNTLLNLMKNSSVNSQF